MEEWKKVANQLDKDHAKGTEAWSVAAVVLLWLVPLVYSVSFVTRMAQNPLRLSSSCRHFSFGGEGSKVSPL